MKVKFLFILVLLCSTALGGGYYYRKKTPASVTVNTSKQEDKKVFESTKTTYYVPVTGIKNKKINITFNEITKLDNLYLLKSEEEQIKKLSNFTSAVTSFATVEELITKLNNEEAAIGIVSMDNLSFKLKALELDSQYIFDRTSDLTKYALKNVEKSTSEIQKDNQTNFDPKKLVKIGHTGSMIPARGVQYWTEKKFNNDYTHIFQSTKPLFDTFDNLSSTFEISLEGNGKPCDKCMVFSGPEKFMEGVKYSGIDFYTMAANHILDGGVSGIANTQKLLDEAGIKYTGASTKNNDDAGKPVLVEVNGLKIAYLGFNDTPGYEEWAGDNKPGAASISDVEWDTKTGVTTKYEPNEARIKYFLQRAKDLKPDFIAVLMHWGGTEYVNAKLPYQERLADLLVKNGADMILGDHVHWTQEIQFKGDKPVFYGVGNFIFDQMWSTETRQGMTIELNIYNKKIVNYRLHPHQLDLYDKGSVELLKPDQPEYQQVLDRVYSVSNFKETNNTN